MRKHMNFVKKNTEKVILANFIESFAPLFGY